MNIKDIFKIAWFPVLVASLCHLSPIVLVLFGLSSVAFASSLTDTLCGEYIWAFRMMGVIFLGVTLVHFFRRKGIKTRSELKRQSNQVINLTLIVILFSLLSYIFFMYVVLEYFNMKLGITSI